MKRLARLAAEVGAEFVPEVGIGQTVVLHRAPWSVAVWISPNGNDPYWLAAWCADTGSEANASQGLRTAVGDYSPAPCPWKATTVADDLEALLGHLAAGFAVIAKETCAEVTGS